MNPESSDTKKDFTSKPRSTSERLHLIFAIKPTGMKHKWNFVREIWRSSGLQCFQPAFASLEESADFQQEAAADDDDEVQRATLDEAASNLAV